jgi:hypothetical protein
MCSGVGNSLWVCSHDVIEVQAPHTNVSYFCRVSLMIYFALNKLLTLEGVVSPDRVGLWRAMRGDKSYPGLDNWWGLIGV